MIWTARAVCGYPGGMPHALLRPWRPEDANDLHDAVASSPDLATQLPVADLAAAEACRDFIAARLAPVTDGGRNVAIEVGGAVVGNVGISAVERRHGTGWVHYWLTTSARGKGLAAAAVATVADWALTEHDLFRLELGHRVNNPASCAVARRAGFLAEGVERAKLAYAGERFDVETHARLLTDPTPSGSRLEVAPGTW